VKLHKIILRIELKNLSTTTIIFFPKIMNNRKINNITYNITLIPTIYNRSRNKIRFL